MIRYALLLLIGVVLTSISALAQVGLPGPSGDFRVDDRPGNAPTVGSPGGPSLPPGPALFRDSLGGKSADETLKRIDKDLGKSSFDRSGAASGSRSLELEREIHSHSERFFK